ncbi:acyltransferase family protein [Pedobacter duraquae]|uniref:Peptidoglycan/LPS O-acetylase OafA/YrhL n=1 Tax=Pedobacter duraquae TaxID=425511 RepID=A0A4R6IA02_9SPHI|nr:peptidoglycan/LPS O-acetylase OafA/YrhL [Pedobacter duraquae]
MNLNKSQRLFEIDLLRFIAAMSVVLFHFTISVKNSHGFYLLKSSTLNKIFNYGYLGAELFFMISGFVILMSVRATSPIQFVKSRIIRLYPSFVPICLFCWVMGNYILHTLNIGLFGLLLNISMIGLMFTNKYISGVYWTLRIEFQFYILVFLLLVTKNIGRIRIFLVSWLVISIICHVGINYLPQINIFKVLNILRFVLFTQFSSFFIGGCFFYLIKYENKKGDRAAALFTTISSCILCPIGANNFLIQSGIIILFFGIFYLITLPRFTFRFISFQSSLLMLGALTYPLYLIHEAFGEPIIQIMILLGIPHDLIFVIAIITVIALAFIIQKTIERPLTKQLKSILQ